MGEFNKQAANTMNADTSNVFAVTPTSGKASTSSAISEKNNSEPTVFEGIFKDAVEDVSAELSANTTEIENGGQDQIARSLIPEGQELPLTGEDLPVLLPGVISEEPAQELDLDLVGVIIPEAPLLDTDNIIEDVTESDLLVDVESAFQATTPVATTGIATATIPGLNQPVKDVVTAAGSAINQSVSPSVSTKPQTDPFSTQALQASGRETATISSSLTTTTGDSSQSGGQTGEHADTQSKSAMLFSTLKTDVINDKMIQSGIKEAMLSIQPQALDAVSKPLSAPLKVGTETFQMQQPVDKPGWSQEFTHRLMWMNKQGVQQVRLQMNPANLGSIDVKVVIQNDQASVSFLSQHGVVRDAIEASLPRLREMMNDAGVKLDTVDVSTQADQQYKHGSLQHAHYNPSSRDERLRDDDSGDASGVVVANLPVSGKSSAVDYYV